MEEFSELEHTIESRLLVGLTGTVFKILRISGSQKFSMTAHENVHWDLQSIAVKKIKVLCTLKTVPVNRARQFLPGALQYVNNV